MGNTYKDSNIYFSRFSKDCVYPSDYPSEPHTHEVCELLFTKKGNPRYFVEGKNYKLGKNSLVISRAGDRHKIYFDEPGPYARYNILFNEKSIPFDLFTKIPAKLDIINFDGNPIVSDLFKRADYYFEHFEGEKLGKLLVGITEELFFNISIAIDENALADCESASSNPVITAALGFIEENLTSNLSIEDICDQLYITKSHLHHLFVNHLQISPKKYILLKRLNLAKRAIRAGQKPIEACMQSGFSDYSTFYRDYRSAFGHPPSKELNFEPDMGNADFYSSL